MVVSKCFCQVEAAAVAVAVGIVDSKKNGVFQLVDLDFGLDCKPPLRCALAESLAVGAPSRSFLGSDEVYQQAGTTCVQDLSSCKTQRRRLVLLASRSVTAVEAMADGGEVLLRRGGERHNTTRHAGICCKLAAAAKAFDGRFVKGTNAKKPPNFEGTGSVNRKCASFTAFCHALCRNRGYRPVQASADLAEPSLFA